MAVSPPKPWERSTPIAPTGSLPAHHPPLSASSNPANCPVSKASASSPQPSSSGTQKPELPPKPTTMLSSDPVAPLSSNGYQSPYGSGLQSANPYASRYGGYGLSPAYGGYGGASGFGGYSRLGSMGSYGGYGGLGYGGMGGMGGYGGMFGGPANPLGMGGTVDPNLVQPSLSQTLANSTQSTFQLLESLVMAFSGFSQLLESTLMMTQSSFFTFIQLIEQFNLFKFSIGKILSLFDLLKWAKGILTGQRSFRSGSDQGETSWGRSFRKLDRTAGEAGQEKPGRPSRKPIVIFFLTVFGIPYLMNKLVRALVARQQQRPLDGTRQAQHQATVAIDPSSLTFVRAVHAYRPGAEQHEELSFGENEIIAVILPTSAEERAQLGWWKGRLRDGRIGWFPKNYVAEIPTQINPSSTALSTPAKAEMATGVETQTMEKRSERDHWTGTVVGNEQEENGDTDNGTAHHRTAKRKLGLQTVKY